MAILHKLQGICKVSAASWRWKWRWKFNEPFNHRLLLHGAY